MPPFLPNKTHAKPKNRKDLQLVFLFLLSSLVTLSAERTISFLESGHSASGPGWCSCWRQGREAQDTEHESLRPLGYCTSFDSWLIFPMMVEAQ